MTANDFLKWLAFSKPGDQITYHQGDLVPDARAVYGMRDAEKMRAAKVAELRKAAQKAQERGDVQLVQSRLGLGRFAYIAIRSKKREEAK